MQGGRPAIYGEAGPLVACTRGGILALALALAGCATAPVVAPPPPAPVAASASPAPDDPARTTVIFTAMQMVGTPYRLGGTGPDSFDCSGLVQYVYRNAGIVLPRTAAEQLQATTPLTLEQAAPGDLLFFRDGGQTSHVAIYLGQGRFVHAPSGGKTVSLDSFANAWYRMHFSRAGRVPAG